MRVDRTWNKIYILDCLEKSLNLIQRESNFKHFEPSGEPFLMIYRKVSKGRWRTWGRNGNCFLEGLHFFINSFVPDQRLFPEVGNSTVLQSFSTPVLRLLSSCLYTVSSIFFSTSLNLFAWSPPVIPTIHQFRIDGSCSSTLFTVVSSRPLSSSRNYSFSLSWRFTRLPTFKFPREVPHSMPLLPQIRLSNQFWIRTTTIRS